MKNDNVSLFREIEKLTEDNNFLAEEVLLILNFVLKSTKNKILDQ